MSTPPVKKNNLISSSSPIAAVDALAALRQVVDAASSYGHLRQVEMTKRAAIATQEQMEVSRIRAAEATLKLYFDRVFEERASTLDEMFTRLDVALESGDVAVIQAVAHSLVTVAQSSPLAGLADFSRFWSEMGTEDNPVEL